MSRELLKRAISCKSIGYPLPASVQQEIDAYLAQPEPEPVAWMVENHPANDTFVNFTPNFNSHFEKLCCKVTPLYTAPPDQSAQIAELKKDNNITHENLAWYMEKYHEHLTIIAELEKSEAFLKDAVDRAIQDTEYYQEQLAALQAKREPLSDDEIQDIHNELPSRSTYYEFARAIEAAHGIGINHE